MDVASTDTAPELDTADADLSVSDVTMSDGGVDLVESCAVAGAWGCECQSDTECDSAFCARGPDAHRCAVGCDQGCPADWRCESIGDSESDTRDLCVPAYAALCRPCQSDADCGQAGDLSAACLEHANGVGFYCGAHCDEMTSCPTGYECAEITLDDGSPVSQCVPLNGGACACNGLASAESASTTCALTNEHGTCSGDRSCGEPGLSECAALSPSPEVCDGVDNNCDGEIDEALGVILCGEGVCETTVDACVEGAEPLCEPIMPPDGVTEVCNGLDDDCDGNTDEELGALSCGIGLCMTSVPACLQGTPNLCEPLFQPGEIAEACNGIDDDCDGDTDEDLIDCE